MMPLLRSPPFPGVPEAVAAISRVGPAAARPVDRARLADLVSRIAAADLAGSFWLNDPARDAREARLIAAIFAGDVDQPGLAEALLGHTYRDPFTDEDIPVEAAVDLLAFWAEVLAANSGIVAAAGMAWWKRRQIARFLWSGRPLRFVGSTAQAEEAVRAARPDEAAVAVWPSRMPVGLDAAGLPLVMVEDGFIRSVGLGSNLHPPLSVAVDRRGIHYDPSRPSDLEVLLQTADMPDDLLARANALRRFVVDNGVSKYGVARRDGAVLRRGRDATRIVLVPGQVEDDMSVRLGGAGITSNLELVARVRATEPSARILFKPHPDVDAGHRPGRVADAEILRHADEIIRDEPMPHLLDRVDAVHVLTSLTGFEALLRDLPVTCHGQPFFAGWGLTVDLARPIHRRTRRLTLTQLIAGVLILYPRYMDPITGLPCSAEILIRRLAGQGSERPGWLVRTRRMQGRIARTGWFRRLRT